MKKEKLTKVFTMIIGLFFMVGACSSPVTEQPAVAIVQRGELAVIVRADGNIEMPDALNLYFDSTMFTPPYSTRIKNVYVQKGDIVHAGALLAKLDDTAQKLAVQSAQYALELAMNNVVQSVCCGASRSPSFYADAVALLRYEFALKEMQKARSALEASNPQGAAEQMSLAKHDIEGARVYYTSPDYKDLRLEFNDLDQAVASSQDLETAIKRLEQESDTISGLQEKVKSGEYAAVEEELSDMWTWMNETHTVIKRVTHLPGSFNYPDMPTTYTIVNELVVSLDVLDGLATGSSYDPIVLSERLSMVRHDLELTRKILEENISTYRLGLNLKTLRDYNINIQNAIINLERAKQSLLKTELIAPFDGRVVDINLQAGDMITQRYSATGTPIDSYVLRLVNTGNLRMAGIVDEIDVLKLAEGQTANVYVDALPGRVFKGVVKFISPYGSLQSRSIPSYGSLQSTLATYKIEVMLDAKDSVFLTGGLTATAEIPVTSKSGVLIIPIGALLDKTGEYYVRVLKDEKTNLIEQRIVQAGLQNQSHTEIISGLSEGEKVILQRSAAPSRAIKK